MVLQRACIALILGLVCHLISGGWAANAEPALRVDLLSPQLTAVPGELVTHTFLISNLTNQPQQVTLTWKKPGDWLSLGEPDFIELSGNEQAELFYTVILPPRFTGKQGITLTATIENAVVAEATGWVEAVPVIDVRVRAPAGKSLFAGEETTYTFTVTNAGNVSDQYTLTATSPQQWPLEIDAAAATLDPGESRDVTLLLRIPQSAQGSGLIEFVAVSRVEPSIVGRSSVTTRILGALAQDRSLYTAIQARGTLAYRDGTPTFKLNAGGALDPENRDFRALDLGLSTVGITPTGGRLAYDNRTWAAQAGVLSVDQGRYLVMNGLGVDWTSLSWPFRWGATLLADGEIGVRAQHLTNGLQLNSGVTGRFRGSDSTPFSWNVGVARREEVPWKWSLQSDLAQRLGADERPVAWRLGMQMEPPGHKVAATVDHRAPGFSGLTATSNLTGGWTRVFSEGRSIGTQLGVRREEPQDGFVRTTFEDRTNFTFQLSPASSLALEHRGEWSVEVEEPFDRNHTLTISARLSRLGEHESGNLAGSYSVQSGTRWSDLATTQVESVRVNWRSNLGTARVTTGIGYSRGHNFEGVIDRRLQFSGDVVFFPIPTASLALGARYESLTADAESKLDLSARYEQRLSPTTTGIATGSWSSQGGRRAWNLNVEARFDFALPIPIPIRGRVEGQVVSPTAGVDVGRLIVRSGDLRTITDAEGRFVFPALPAGELTFTIENLPAQFTVTTGAVATLVQAGETSHLTIEFERTVGVEGRIELVRDPFAFSFGDPPSMGQIRVVLLRHGEEVAETFTDANGNFVISDVLPGEYEVAIDESWLPSGVRLEETLQKADLQLGEWANLAFTASEESLEIEFMPLGPAASFAFQPREPTAGEVVTFIDESLVDPQRTLERMEWEFGDGNAGSGPTVTHTFTEPGRYSVRLTVTDSAGESDSLERIVVVR